MSGKVLVTGATGYVASRLLPALIEAGHTVRATSRNPSSLRAKYPGVEVVPSDLGDAASLAPALADIDVAFYLVHSMEGGDFDERDRRAAGNFLAAAEAAGVSRIVYLGGLGRSDDRGLSSHLRSRQEVGRILAAGDIQVIELRASIVIGAGSAAFEMLRYLTERLPFMVAPRWLSTRTQPIGEADLVRYLVAGATADVTGDRVVEIGVADVLTYRDMILGYARERGLRRRIVSVPVLSPKLSSYWVDLVTPIDAALARPLIDGLKNEVVVTDDSAAVVFPEIAPAGYGAAVRASLEDQVERMTEADPRASGSVPGDLAGFLLEERSVATAAPPSEMSAELLSIGGDPRWYPLRWAWWIRARLDDLFGGAGLEWIRPAGGLEPGARVDWWTVEEASSEQLLVRAEMRLPGEAWVRWRVSANPGGGSSLRQTAFMRPKGLLGRLYWWLLLPFHKPIFSLMAKRLAERAASRT